MATRLYKIQQTTNKSFITLSLKPASTYSDSGCQAGNIPGTAQQHQGAYGLLRSFADFYGLSRTLCRMSALPGELASHLYKICILEEQI